MNHLSPVSSKFSRNLRSPQVKRYKSLQKVRSGLKNDSIEELKSFVPEWLTSNKDFVTSYKKMKHQVDINLADVCQRSCNSRTKDEKKALFQWASTKSYFQGMSKAVIKKVCDKFTSVYYKPGEYIITEGEEPMWMFMIYEGDVAIYMYDQKINYRNSGDPLGETALDNDSLRTANAIAETNVTAFKLKRSDYEDIILTIKKNEKKKYLQFLKSMKIFKTWNDVKIMMLSHVINVCTYQKGESIYQPHDFSHSFYIIKEGTVEIQTEIKILEENKWPTSPREWNVRKVTKKIYHPIRFLSSKGFFGHIEILDKTCRQTRAIATADSIVFVVNRAEFEDIFNQRDRELLKCDSELPSKEDIELMIKKSHSDILEKEKILLSAVIENKGGRYGNNKKLEKWLSFVKDRIVSEKNNMRKTIVKHTLENIKFIKE